MKVTFNETSTLLTIIKTISKVAVQKAGFDVLNNFVMTAESGLLSIEATCLDVSVRRYISEFFVIEEEGTAVINAKKALAALAALKPSKPVVIQSDSKSASITQKITKNRNASTTLAVVDRTEYPPINLEVCKSDYIEVEARALADSISAVLPTVTTDSTRPDFTGINFDCKTHAGNLILVSTDGHRLSRANNVLNRVHGTFTDAAACIVPREACAIIEAECKKLINATPLGFVNFVRLSVRNGKLVIYYGDPSDGFIMSANLINGAFPDFTKVISKDGARCVVDSEEMIKVAAQVKAFAPESRTTKVSFDDGGIILSTCDGTNAAQTYISAVFDGKEPPKMDFGFNIDFLISALKCAGKGFAELRFTDADSPSTVCPQHAFDRFVVVLMPMQLP